MSPEPIHVDFECGATAQAGLEARGITVHRVAFGNHTEDGGSIRYSTHPLVRRLGPRRSGRVRRTSGPCGYRDGTSEGAARVLS